MFSWNKKGGILNHYCFPGARGSGKVPTLPKQISISVLPHGLLFYFIKIFHFLASPFSTVILLNDQKFWPAATQGIWWLPLIQKALQIEACNVCLRKTNSWHFLTLYALCVNHCYLHTITFDFGRLQNISKGILTPKYFCTVRYLTLQCTSQHPYPAL